MENTVRVRLAYRLPVEPLEIATMADYDLSLLLSDTWFEYDGERKAKPNLVKSWSFDTKTGYYTFRIDPKRKWSNGTVITSNHLIWNLKRAIQKRSSYGVGIEAIVDIEQSKIIDDLNFMLKIKDEKPSELFFQRMGAQGLAVVHPDDVDQQTLRVISNKLSSGPFQIKESVDSQVTLVRNSDYSKFTPESTEKIHIQKTDPSFDLRNFLSGKSWENIVQINTFLPSELLEDFKKVNPPHWSRGHDRVSLLKPINQRRTKELKLILLKIAEILEKENFKSLQLNAKRARSLQPFGYPLFNEVEPKRINEAPIFKTASILLSQSPSSLTHMALLDPILKSHGFKISWNMKPRDEVLKQFYANEQNNSTADFILFDFGVADPEPATWMTVVMDNHFIQYTSSQKNEFSLIVQEKDKTVSTQKFKDLLKSIYLDGGYLPLFHFSTLSVGARDLNFDQIKELDETVNYSKITFKKPKL